MIDVIEASMNIQLPYEVTLITVPKSLLNSSLMCDQFALPCLRTKCFLHLEKDGPEQHIKNCGVESEVSTSGNRKPIGNNGLLCLQIE